MKTMNNKTLETTCDIVMMDLYEQLVTLQNEYKDEDVVEDLGLGMDGKPQTRTYKRKKYFQMLETHSIIPADGATATPDIGDKKPTDQSEKLSDFGLILPAKMPLSVSVEPYEDDNGWGWTLTGTVIDGADTYQRTMNFGYHAEREKDWVKKI